MSKRTEKHLPLRKAKEAQVAINREKDNILFFKTVYIYISFLYFCIAYCNDDKAIFTGFSLTCLESWGFFKWEKDP